MMMIIPDDDDRDDDAGRVPGPPNRQGSEGSVAAAARAAMETSSSDESSDSTHEDEIDGLPVDVERRNRVARQAARLAHENPLPAAARAGNEGNQVSQGTERIDPRADENPSPAVAQGEGETNQGNQVVGRNHRQGDEYPAPAEAQGEGGSNQPNQVVGFNHRDVVGGQVAEAARAALQASSSEESLESAYEDDRARLRDEIEDFDEQELANMHRVISNGGVHPDEEMAEAFAQDDYESQYGPAPEPVALVDRHPLVNLPQGQNRMLSDRSEFLLRQTTIENVRLYVGDYGMSPQMDTFWMVEDRLDERTSERNRGFLERPDLLLYDSPGRGCFGGHIPRSNKRHPRAESNRLKRCVLDQRRDMIGVVCSHVGLDKDVQAHVEEMAAEELSIGSDESGRGPYGDAILSNFSTNVPNRIKFPRIPRTRWSTLVRGWDPDIQRGTFDVRASVTGDLRERGCNYAALTFQRLYDSVVRDYGNNVEWSHIYAVIRGHPRTHGPPRAVMAYDFYGKYNARLDSIRDSNLDCLPVDVPRGPGDGIRKHDGECLRTDFVYLVHPAGWRREHPGPYGEHQDVSTVRRNRKEKYGRLHPPMENVIEGPFKVLGVPKSERLPDGTQWELVVLERQVPFFPKGPMAVYLQETIPVCDNEFEVLDSYTKKWRPIVRCNVARSRTTGEAPVVLYYPWRGDKRLTYLDIEATPLENTPHGRQVGPAAYATKCWLSVVPDRIKQALCRLLALHDGATIGDVKYICFKLGSLEFAYYGYDERHRFLTMAAICQLFARFHDRSFFYTRAGPRSIQDMMRLNLEDNCGRISSQLAGESQGDWALRQINRLYRPRIHHKRSFMSIGEFFQATDRWDEVVGPNVRGDNGVLIGVTGDIFVRM